MGRKWRILTIILSLITGILIGYFLKIEPVFSIYALLASLGLTIAWGADFMLNIFRNSESERIRREGILVEDFRKWFNIPTKIEILQKDGEEITYPTNIYQSLSWYPEEVNILKKNKIYPHWKNGIKNAYKILSDGRNAYHNFLILVDRKFKATSFKKIMGFNLGLNTYSYPFVCNAIVEKINGDNSRLELSATITYNNISITYLQFGTKNLACGGEDELSDFKNLIMELIQDKEVKENIEKFNQAKMDLKNNNLFNAFETRLNKWLLDWELFHEFKPQL